MRNLKKVISLVLALVFVLGLATIGASAAYTDDESIEYTDAVATTSSLGIFNGYEDGSFKPAGDITRQEVAKMIAVALNGGSFDPSLYANASIFSDVDGLWGEGYINYLAGLDILAGVGDGKFNPQGKITAQELAKILLVSLGYPSELFVGSKWASSVNRVAVSIKLYQDYTGSYAKALTREEAALIIYNALTKSTVQAKWSSTVDAEDESYYWTWDDVKDKEGKTVTFLNKYFKADSNLGFVTATAGEFTELTGTNVVVSYCTTTNDNNGALNLVTTSTEYKTFRDGIYDAIADKVASFDGKLGDAVTVFTNAKTKAVIAVASRTIEKDLTEKTIISYSTTAKLPKASDLKTALLNAGFYSALVTYGTSPSTNYETVYGETDNGKDLEFRQYSGSTVAIAQANAAQDGFSTFGCNAVQVGGYYYIIAQKTISTFEPYKLASTNATQYTFSDITGAAYSGNPIYKTASKNIGKFYKYDSLEKGEWYTIKSALVRNAVKSIVAATYGSSTEIYNIKPVDKVVAGAVKAVSTNTVTVNDTVYGLRFNSKVTADEVYDAGLARTADGYAGVDLYLDPYGYIFDATTAESATVSSDYVYIINADVDVKGSGAFKTYSAKVQVLTDDGSYGVYTLNLKYNKDKYYSGAYEFTGVDTTSAATEASSLNTILVGNSFSYIINDGVLTLVKQANKATVSTSPYAGYKGATSSKVADSYVKININSADKVYFVNSATEFVYMKLPTGVSPDYSKSKVVSVGLSGALDINNGVTVFVVTDKTSTDVVTKLIAVDTSFNISTEQAYVFVDKLASKYKDANETVHYTFHYFNADGSEGTATTTTNLTTNEIYAIMSDGSIDNASDASKIKTGTITAINGTTLTINSTDYYTLPSEVVPVLIGDAEYGVGETVKFSIGANGAINGIWAVE